MTNKPIYIIIYDKLKSAIKGGTYPPGSFLPTEQELETLYQVSRTTIRRAVKLLSDEGILSVRQGCGTMVMDIRTTQNYNQVTSVTESLRKRGYDVTTGSMMIDVIPASRDIAADLFIPEGTPVARIQRLQLADGRPVTLMENYIEYAKVPGIEQHSGHFVALYQFLEETYGLIIDATRDRISAKSADFLEARVLEIEPKTALLVIRRISYYQDKPVSIDHVRIIGSQYEAEISGKGRSKYMCLTELAKKIDISCVQAFHTRDEIDSMIEAAIRYHFAAAFTLPAFSSYIAKKLADYPDIHTGGVISFPGGGDTIFQKSRQAKELREAGCKELDMVMNLTALRSHEDNYVLEDIGAVREAAGKDILKVIIEAPQLTEEEIRRAVNLCIRAGADYAKTSTGWYPAHPSALSQVQIMTDEAKGRIKIKAAGGIRTLETIHAMEKAGCDRFGIGLSSALKLFTDLS